MSLNEQLNEQSALKICTQDYIIYNREWLFEHLESEYKLLKESRKRKLSEKVRIDKARIKLEEEDEV